MNKHLQSIAEEKDRFSFGESWRYSEDSLVSLLPILRKTSKKRNYILFSEAEKVSVRDTGNIGKIEFENREEKPVYIRMGEIFSGKTQERAAVRSYVVMPKEKINIDVKCVHASKGINTDAPMSSGGIGTTNIDKEFITSSIKMRSPEQGRVWRIVQEDALYFDGASNAFYASTTASSSDSPSASSQGVEFGDETSDGGNVTVEMPEFTDDLKENIESFGKVINNILEKVPYFENQIGIALLDLKGVNGIECFDLKQSWKALKNDIVKKEGEHLVKEEKDSPFEYKKSKALKSVKNVLMFNYIETPVFKSKDYKVTVLQGDGYIGEIVELNDKLLHLTLIRK